MGLTFGPVVRAAIAALPAPVKRRIKAALRMIADDPADDRLDLKLLSGRSPESMYRCRVQSHRIIYAVRPDVTHNMRIMHRRDGYGWLERL